MKVTFTYKELPPAIAEAKTRAILRTLAAALKKQRLSKPTGERPSEHSHTEEKVYAEAS